MVKKSWCQSASLATATPYLPAQGADSSASPTSNPSPQPARDEENNTYRKESAYAGPHGVIGQLAPSALVHDCALVYAATGEIYEDCDDGDNAEDATRSQRL